MAVPTRYENPEISLITNGELNLISLRDFCGSFYKLTLGMHLTIVGDHNSIYHKDNIMHPNHALANNINDKAFKQKYQI